MRGIVVALIVLAGASPASAVTLVDSRGRTPQPFQRWADAARVPTVPGAVRMIGTRCPLASGEYACAGSRTIWFYMPGLERLEARGDLLHELGHVFDYERLTDRTRNRFRRIMRERRTWEAAPNSPHEQFAEAYALCGLGGRAARRFGYGGYAYSPTKRQNRAVCRLLRTS